MLIYPTIKEAPLAGLAGFGGGTSSLVTTGGGFTAVLGNAGKSAATYFFRPGKENANDVVEDEKGSFPDFHIINPSNTEAMVATANMPPGMGASRYNTSTASNMATSLGESFPFQHTRMVGGFVMPTSPPSMQMIFHQAKAGNNYMLFVTDEYSNNARYDWPASNYQSRQSENTGWGSTNNELLVNVWNHWRFGRDSDNNVRFIIHTWDGSSWTLRLNLSHSGGGTIGANAGDSWSAFYGEGSPNSSYGSRSRGVPGYWGNVYWKETDESVSADDAWLATPPSD